MKTTGIDVSRWQGTIDWAAVSGSENFACLRATVGDYYTDPTFVANALSALGNGLTVGAYMVHRHSADPVAQAARFTDVAGKADFVVLDVEGSGQTDPPMAATYRRHLHRTAAIIEADTGKVPYIYTNPSWWDEKLMASDGLDFSEYPLWLAHYTAAEMPRLPFEWDDWTIWQYTSTGTVPGVAGNVDRDRINPRRML